MNIVLPISIGLLFGFALQKAGLGHYDTIVNQFRFKDNSMMKFMLSAIATGAVCFFLLKDMGLVAATPIHDTYVAGNLAGGLIFGVGMALAGTCPGTVIAGIGQGNLDYLVAGFLGFLAGALVQNPPRPSPRVSGNGRGRFFLGPLCGLETFSRLENDYFGCFPPVEGSGFDFLTHLSC